MNNETLKKMVGIESTKYIKSGMTVGLGTGSTAYYMIREVGRLVNEEKYELTCVCTSDKTRELALSLGLQVKNIDEVDYVDITIDGADEISDDFQGIKGGGAALLNEKIVATYSNEIIWIVDKTKLVKHLGKFPLPVEVIKNGSSQLFKEFEKAGFAPKFRTENDGTLLLTDNKNYIIDLQMEKITDPHSLGRELKQMVGVVEHGLFLDMLDITIVGYSNGPQIIVCKQ